MPGQPIPPGWRWGDPTPAPELLGKSAVSPSSNETLGVPTHDVDINAFQIEGLNMTEIALQAVAANDDAVIRTTSRIMQRNADCCMMTWDCMMFLKYGPWSLLLPATTLEEKMSSCCITTYWQCCNNPQRGPHFDFNYPPACS
jgi:hypothetical protein